MNINVKRCYFHSIQPLIREDKKEDIDEQIDRLNCMLDYGYIVPECELYDVFKEEYKNLPNNGDDSVYLAQHILTELNSVGGSFFNGEFSAYFEHIRYSPSLVFDEHIIDGKRIDNHYHFLSEEVCIQERIPLKDVIAIALPYRTPLERINSFINHCEEEDQLSIEECFSISVRRELAEEVMSILNEKEVEIDKQYERVQKFEKCLEKHQLSIPCIRYDGSFFNKEEEYDFIKKNKAKVLRLIDETKKI